MSFGPLTFAEYVGRISIETLEVLMDIMESPQSAYLYCDAVGLPPIGPSTEWAPAVQELRQKGDAATEPEHWAEITELVIKLIAGLKAKFLDQLPPSSTAPGFVESISTKVLLPVLLYVLPRFDYLTWMNPTARFFFYAVLEVSFFARPAASGRLSARAVRGTMVRDPRRSDAQGRLGSFGCRGT